MRTKNYSYLFTQFNNSIIDPANKKDPVKTQMQKVAKENGLLLAFNRHGVDNLPSEGGAAVMGYNQRPDNEVITLLTEGADGKWRVHCTDCLHSHVELRHSSGGMFL